MNRIAVLALAAGLSTPALAADSYKLCGHGYVRALISANSTAQDLPGGIAVLLDEVGFHKVDRPDSDYWAGTGLSPGSRNIVIGAKDSEQNITAASIEELLRMAFAERLPVEILMASEGEMSCRTGDAQHVVVKVCGVESDCNQS